MTRAELIKLLNLCERVGAFQRLRPHDCAQLYGKHAALIVQADAKRLELIQQAWGRDTGDLPHMPEDT